MAVQDTSQLKDKILFILKSRGPSLPVHIAKEMGLSILFASVFLSELVSEKQIKTSHMKVGNSPIYFLMGQEFLLEKFSQYLHSKEKEAFLLLKENKILKDKTQEPAITVALRAIKDFAIPFEKNEEIFWRYFSVDEKEFKKTEKIPVQKIKETTKQKPKELNIFDKPSIKSPTKSAKRKNKEKSEFVITVLNSLKQNNIELSEEIEIKKKEFIGTAKIHTNLGKIEVLIIGKDKKKITENDLQIVAQKSNVNKKIALFISSGELDKKALKFLEEYKNIIKFLNLKRNF